MRRMAILAATATRSRFGVGTGAVDGMFDPRIHGRVGRGRRESGRVAMVLAIVLGACAVAGGIWFAFMPPDSKPKGIDDFETPAWADVRQSALPLVVPEPSEPERPQNVDAPSRRPEMDPRVVEIADNLNKQFARNPGQETAFTDAFPRRALQSWIKDRAGIPGDRREHFIDSLVAASRGIGDDPAINRIGAVPARVKVIQDALFAYRDEYRRRAEAALRAQAGRRTDDAFSRSDQRTDGLSRADSTSRFETGE